MSRRDPNSKHQITFLSSFFRGRKNKALKEEGNPEPVGEHKPEEINKDSTYACTNPLDLNGTINTGSSQDYTNSTASNTQTGATTEVPATLYEPIITVPHITVADELFGGRGLSGPEETRNNLEEHRTK